MKKNIYIVNNMLSSKENGIGTYIQELLYCLKTLDVNLYLLSFNSMESEFMIIIDGEVTEMKFPKFPCDNFMNCADLIDGFLQLYVVDSFQNVFILNHSPCNNLIISIRKSHPLSKIIFVIHNLFWTSGLLGNATKMHVLIQNRHREFIKRRFHNQLRCYDMEKCLFEMSDAVVCLSKDTLGMLQKVYCVDTKNVFLIPNGIRDQISLVEKMKEGCIREEFGISADDKILLFVGRLTLVKGLGALLKALHLIQKKYPKLKLALAGNMALSDLPQVEYQKIASNIIFLGQLSPQDLRKWYAISDIGVVPSYCEQCSYVGIEMLMYGLPIIAANAFGVKNMFMDNVNAKIAVIGNRKNEDEFAANLAKSISSLLDSEQLLVCLSVGARKFYNESYNIQRMKEGYESLICSLIQ